MFVPFPLSEPSLHIRTWKNSDALPSHLLGWRYDTQDTGSVCLGETASQMKLISLGSRYRSAQQEPKSSLGKMSVGARLFIYLLFPPPLFLLVPVA